MVLISFVRLMKVFFYFGVDDKISITLAITEFRIRYCIKSFPFFFFYHRNGRSDLR